MRIGIVGMGWVGSSVAASILHRGVARELLLNDTREAIAEGEAMDLSHGQPFVDAVDVRCAEVEAMKDLDAVVVAAGRGGDADESRLGLLKDNAAIVRSIGEKLRGHAGLVVMVTNPVDVLTQVMTEATGLPPARVIGTGTLLDTARLRQVLGSELELSPRSIHAQVVGEHGDSEVALFSSARVGGRPLRSWPGWSRERERSIGERVRRAAHEIIRRKGATNHAIGMVTASLLRWALRDERRVLTVSRVQEGLGDAFEGVATSLPAVVDRAGARAVRLPEMDDAERAALEKSCAVLRQARASLGEG